jgi:hypothetical protein
MEFTQRKVIVVQTTLMIANILVFFTPAFGALDIAEAWILNIPFGVIYLGLTILALLVGLILNIKNEPSFKSAYFLGAMFLPLLWVLDLLFIGVYWGFPSLEFWPYWSILTVSNVLVIAYLFYGLFYKDPLDWTSHKVEPKIVNVKLLPQFVFLFVLVVILIGNYAFYVNDVSRDSEYLISFWSLTESLFYLWIIFPWLLITLLINNRFFVGISDRLYFFVAISLAFFPVLLIESSYGIDDFLFGLSDLGWNNPVVDFFQLSFTFATYLIVPLVLVVFSFWFYKKYEMQLEPYVARSFVDRHVKDSANQSEATGSMDPSVATPSDSWNNSSQADWSEGDDYYSNDSPQRQSGTLQLDRNRIFMAIISIVFILIFILATNLKIYTVSLGDAFSIRLSFWEIREGIEILEAFAEGSEISILIGLYGFFIIVTQLAATAGQLYVKPKFNNKAFLTLFIAQFVHLGILGIIAARILIAVNEFNSGLSAFGISVSFGLGFGMVLHVLLSGAAIYLYTSGNQYLPQIYQLLKSMDFGTSGGPSIENRSASPRSSYSNEDSPRERRPLPPRPPRPPRPAIHEESTPPPRPPRPAPRTQPQASPVSQEPSDLEKNLASLKRLLDEGLITEAEFQEKKKQQLDKYM